MDLRKYRWSKDYESAEEELENLLAAMNITAERWTAKAGEAFAPHMNTLDKRLWCAEGSIVFTVNGKPISLQPGDALNLPKLTAHEALAGISGCTCYESPVPALNSAA
jgi:quercetin dioxygenase-like cupin family protein